MVQTSAAKQTWQTFLTARASHGGWKGDAARRLLTCDSLAALRTRLADPDPNTRIIATRALAAEAVDMDDNEKAQAVAAIRSLVQDPATNDVGYADFGCEDDEAPVRVCDVALAALEILDPGWKPPRK